MPRIFTHQLTVADAEIDPLGHANNVSYLTWTEAAAVAHSSAVGWTAERYRQQSIAWVVRSHHIEYLRPAEAGDSLTIETWVGDIGRVQSTRHYEIRRGERELIARAQTLWVFIDTQTGRPRRIPEELRAAFEIVTER